MNYMTKSVQRAVLEAIVDYELSQFLKVTTIKIIKRRIDEALDRRDYEACRYLTNRLKEVEDE